MVKVKTIFIILSIIAFLIVGGILFDILQTAFVQPYFLSQPVPINIVSENPDSIIFSARWSTPVERRDRFMSGENFISISGIQTYKHGDPTFTVFYNPDAQTNKRFKASNVDIAQSCILDYQGNNQRAGNLIINNETAFCIIRQDTSSSPTFTYMECDFSYNFECRDVSTGEIGDLQHVALITPDTVEITVEALKHGVQCTDSQISLCSEDQSCDNLQCATILISGITGAVINEQNQTVEIIENQVVIENETIGTIENNTIIDSEGNEIGRVEGNKVILTEEIGQKFNVVGIVMIIIVLLLVIIFIILLIRRLRRRRRRRR